MKAGYQGEAYSYSHRAAREMFPGAELVGYDDFSSCFAALRQEAVERLVLPVENSITGPFTEVVEGLAEHETRMLDELWMEIHHGLLGLPGTGVGEVERVLSHPDALAQAEHVIAEKGWAMVAVEDTAGAARIVAEQGDPTQAALGPTGTAAAHGLEVIEADFMDRPDNATRFVAVRLG